MVCDTVVGRHNSKGRYQQSRELLELTIPQFLTAGSAVTKSSAHLIESWITTCSQDAEWRETREEISKLGCFLADLDMVFPVEGLSLSQIDDDPVLSCAYHYLKSAIPGSTRSRYPRGHPAIHSFILSRTSRILRHFGPDSPASVRTRSRGCIENANDASSITSYVVEFVSHEPTMEEAAWLVGLVCSLALKA